MSLKICMVVSGLILSTAAKASSIYDDCISLRNLPIDSAVYDRISAVEALQAGTIAGAGLDVFEHEPLPQKDPIWSAQNVVLTPHIAGFADIVAEQCLQTVIKNLKIYTKAGLSGLNSAIPNRLR